MATSGRIIGTITDPNGQQANQDIAIYWEVTRQYKSSGSKSNVSVKIQGRRNNTYSAWTNTATNCPYTLTINGTSYSGYVNFNFGDKTVNSWFDFSMYNSSKTAISSVTATVPHGSDGTKTCAFSASLTLYIGRTVTVSISGTGTFNTIPVFAWSKTIATGQSVTNLTASDWNTLNSYIKTYIDTSYSYTTVSAGTPITKLLINQPANKLSVTIDSSSTIKASYFTSLRDKYNAY